MAHPIEVGDIIWPAVAIVLFIGSVVMMFKILNNKRDRDEIKANDARLRENQKRVRRGEDILR
ncbi:hypothetical protein ACO0LO_24420 [Undibacterium sp. TJN25]|uniref:hypothetical protein n=1 Tax=Undibacterium sp. TJN25 TaxID=3413056 RepID=UPI003BF136E3